MAIRPVESAFYASFSFYATRSLLALATMLFCILFPIYGKADEPLLRWILALPLALSSWLLVVWGKRCFSSKPLLEINALGWVDRRSLWRSRCYTWQEVANIVDDNPAYIWLEHGKPIRLHTLGLRTSREKLLNAFFRHWKAYQE